MPKYVYHYFNARSQGEGARMLLAYGGQEFEDRRIEWKDWHKLKPTFPFRQVPVLEIDGKQFAQSLAICRYLGHKYGLAGSTIEEDLEIDQNMEFFNDMRLKVIAVFFEPDPEVKKRKAEETLKNDLPWMYEKLNEIITKNNGHLALGRLTWADFLFPGVYDALNFMLKFPGLDDKYPSFKKLHEKVCSLPKVKEYIAKSTKSH